jgi:hypothetical protein
MNPGRTTVTHVAERAIHAALTERTGWRDRV